MFRQHWETVINKFKWTCAHRGYKQNKYMCEENSRYYLSFTIEKKYSDCFLALQIFIVILSTWKIFYRQQTCKVNVPQVFASGVI